MPAPTANRNAEKWTLQATLDKLEEMEYYVTDDRTHTLGSALCKVRLYTGIWTYWKKRWIDHEEIMEQIYWIEEVFMSKLKEGALTKRYHAGAAMFILRANYGMRDRPMKKDEHLPEEQLLPHLQEELDSIQTAEKIAAMQQSETIVEKPQTEPLPQRTITVPAISYTEAKCPEPQRSQDYQAEPDSWLNATAALKQAA